MYTTETYTATMPLPAFMEKYRDAERFLPFCEACHNYGTVWSCPPHLPPLESQIEACREAYVVAIKILYDEGARALATTEEKVKEITWQTILEVKNDFHQEMLALERATEGSLYLSSGGCTLCPTCQRSQDRPCIHKADMRTSLDAYGFDLTAITEEILGIKLLWSKGELPAYYTLIHALFRP